MLDVHDLQVAYGQPRSVAGFVASPVLYAGTAFGHVASGTPGSLPRIDRNALVALHRAAYRPDNAILVVSGNFDVKQLDAWVDEYFAPLASPRRPIPRVTAEEPVRMAPKSLTVYEANVPLPAVTISWPAPAANNPDLAAWAARVDILREAGTPTVPTTVAHERAVNPFLRSRESTVRQAVRAQGGDVSGDAAAFGALRGWKDGFR